MKNAAKGVVFAIAAALSCPSAADFVLVTPDEYEAHAAAEAEAPRSLLESRSDDPEAPRIIVELPEASAAYTSPVDIRIRFESSDDATLDLDTLEITYGIFGHDVTQRITENATVTESGIEAPGAVLPSGRHRLKISISDTKGRVGERRFRFRIVD